MFFLPPVLTLIIAIPSFVFVIAALTGQLTSPVLTYMVYVLSAYALIISVTGITKIVNFIRNGFREHPFIKMLLAIPAVEKFVKSKRQAKRRNCEDTVCAAACFL